MISSKLNGYHYPVWASIARDYLAIMATSVSSERAFSSAGITVTKRRNRLKGDIVEALQVLKSAFRDCLFFFQAGPASVTEMELDEFEDHEDGDEPGAEMDEEASLLVDLDSDAEDDGEPDFDLA